jgi:hypothetical protein
MKVSAIVSLISLSLAPLVLAQCGSGYFVCGRKSSHYTIVNTQRIAFLMARSAATEAQDIGVLLTFSARIITVVEHKTVRSSARIAVMGIQEYHATIRHLKHIASARPSVLMVHRRLLESVLRIFASEAYYLSSTECSDGSQWIAGICMGDYC